MAPLTIFLTTWNTGLQGSKAQSQDLTSWLLPSLQKTANDPDLPAGQIPDIYAIAVQELLPLHLSRKSFPVLQHDILHSADVTSRRSIPTSLGSSHRPYSIPSFLSCEISLLDEGR